jgi:hypothetical protein
MVEPIKISKKTFLGVSVRADTNRGRGAKLDHVQYILAKIKYFNKNLLFLK